MKRSVHVLSRVIGSSKLALVLVLLLIFLAAAGVILPQEGMFTPVDIARWQDAHPIITSLLKPFGLFHVFHSILFLGIIFLLTVNTLTCTVMHIVIEGGFSALKGPGAVKRVGFVVLHLCIIVLFAGGFWSAAVRMDGYIVLTEGQGLKEEHSSYIRLVRGPLRREKHRGFIIRLNKVHVEYEKKHYPIAVTSHIEIHNNQKKVAEAAVKVNHPFTYRGISFTQDQTGFSPRLIIREKVTRRILIDSFIALKTFRKGNYHEYRDFLPLPFLKKKVIVTLYPTFTRVDGQVKKSSEEPEKPLLLIEMENESGQVVFKDSVPMKGSTEVGDYSFTLAGLRRWSAFKVVEDPGYPIVLSGLWLGIGAILLRYFPDLSGWFIPRRGGSKKTPRTIPKNSNQ